MLISLNGALMTEMSTRFTDNVGTDYQFFSSGEWYEANCGLMAGYMCKKDITVSGPVTVPSTEVWDSRCPTGYYSANYGRVVLLFSKAIMFLLNLAHAHMYSYTCITTFQETNALRSWTVKIRCCRGHRRTTPAWKDLVLTLE